MKYFTTLLLLFLLCIGCVKTESEEIPEHLIGIENLTLYPTDVTAQNDIQFNRTQVFEESEELTIGRISGIAVDESERVYISESTQGHAAIHVFDAEGSYLRSLGGYGEGPGEFRSIINPQIVGDKLYALDGRQLKINIYSIQTFSFENSIQLDPRNWNHIDPLTDASPVDFTPLDNTTFLVSFLKSDGHMDLLYYYIIDRNGFIVSDEILHHVSAEHFQQPDESRVFLSPFSSNGILIAPDSETLYTIWTEDILIKEYDIDGNYHRSFYYPFSNKTLNRDDVLNLYDSDAYRAAVRNTGIPEKWPAVHSLIIDDEKRFWISTIIDDDEAYEWWVLNQEGEMLSQFIWPDNREIQIVRNESLFILETDPDTGLQKVVRYQILLNE